MAINSVANGILWCLGRRCRCRALGKVVMLALALAVVATLAAVSGGGGGGHGGDGGGVEVFRLREVDDVGKVVFFTLVSNERVKAQSPPLALRPLAPRVRHFYLGPPRTRSFPLLPTTSLGEETSATNGDFGAAGLFGGVAEVRVISRKKRQTQW